MFVSVLEKKVYKMEMLKKGIRWSTVLRDKEKEERKKICISYQNLNNISTAAFRRKAICTAPQLQRE